MNESQINQLKVGIVVATLNRPDFVIRQLQYYANLQSPHPVYIGDSSNEENAKKLQMGINKINPPLTVHYYYYPKTEYSLGEVVKNLYDQVNEKYVVFIGDDDYQIPPSLTKCAEFLEHHPDYSNASGQAVSFRLVNNGVYGELKSLSDYPRRQIEAPTAAERLLSFLSKYYVPLFSVHRIEQIRKCWQHTSEIENLNFSTEILPSTMSLVLGKSKIIDCLSFVRQIHDRHIKLPDTFDWIIRKDWASSYETFNKILAEAISNKDGISIEKAAEIVKQAFWKRLAKQLPKGYDDAYEELAIQPVKPAFDLKSMKLKIGQKFPQFKKLYRQIIRPLTKAPLQLHYEALRQESEYYIDFKPVLDSFSLK